MGQQQTRVESILKKNQKKYKKCLLPKELTNLPTEKDIKIQIKPIKKNGSQTVINKFCKDWFVRGDINSSNIIEGRAIAKGPNKEKYIGYWKNNQFNGLGIYEEPLNKIKYVGQFSNDSFNGIGYYTFQNGEVYIGKFKQDQFNGMGIYCYEDGSMYQGSWLNGKKWGQGQYYYIDGERYEGQWKDGKKHGNGSFYYKNDVKYVGQFSNGLRSGNGTMIYQNGAIYQGEWKDGKKSGYGTLYYIKSSKDQCNSHYEGSWKDGKQDGSGKFTFSNGDKYIGKVNKSERQGVGKYMFKNGSYCYGQWRKGKMNGFGLQNWENCTDPEDGPQLQNEIENHSDNDQQHSQQQQLEQVQLTTQDNISDINSEDNFNIQENEAINDNEGANNQVYYTVKSVYKSYEGQWMNQLWHGYGKLQPKQEYDAGVQSYVLYQNGIIVSFIEDEEEIKKAQQILTYEKSELYQDNAKEATVLQYMAMKKKLRKVFNKSIMSDIQSQFSYLNKM